MIMASVDTDSFISINFDGTYMVHYGMVLRWHSGEQLLIHRLHNYSYNNFSFWHIMV